MNYRPPSPNTLSLPLCHIDPCPHVTLALPLCHLLMSYCLHPITSSLYLLNISDLSLKIYRASQIQTGDAQHRAPLEWSQKDIE